MGRWRGPVATVLATALFVLVGCTVTTDGQPLSARPNIIFVLTDDLSNNLVPYMPHVRAMQRAGTSFSHYYVTDSLCCPSRSSIFTGEYPHDTGVYGNVGNDGGIDAYNTHDDPQKSFAVSLQKAGYRTAMMGKYLNGYQASMPPAPGWDEWDVVGDGYDEFDYAMRSGGSEQRYGNATSDYLTDVLASKAANFVDSATDAAEPFMLEVATFAPHAPYVPAPRYSAAEADVTIPRTPAYDAATVNPPSWLAGLPPLSPITQKRLDRLYVQRVRADLATDDLIARLQQQLRAKGLAGNTYFVFSSDNGYHIGEHRLHAGKQTAFETDINVPLVVTGPGVSAGRVETRLASNIDLAPTFEQIAGAHVPPTVDGVSLLGLWRDQSPASWQQAVLVEHRRPVGTRRDPDAQRADAGDPPDYEAVRTATALYVEYGTGEIEYYDTSRDPFELTNLGDTAPASLPRALDALKNCHDTSTCQQAARLR